MKKKCTAIILALLILVMQSPSLVLAEGLVKYPYTKIPAYSTDVSYHYVLSNYIVYCYTNIAEKSLHDYRHCLEACGYTMDSTEYHEDDNFINFRYTKTINEVAELSEDVYIIYEFDTQLLHVLPTDEYTKAMCVDDEGIILHNCDKALLLYRLRYFDDAKTLLDGDMQSSEFKNWSEEEQQFAIQLKSDIEYAITFDPDIQLWLRKIEELYANQMYYEVIDEVEKLKTTYALSPGLFGYAISYKNNALKYLSDWIIFDRCNKSLDYIAEGLYYEAFDEVMWIFNNDYHINARTCSYNHAINTLSIAERGINLLQGYDYYDVDYTLSLLIK